MMPTQDLNQEPRPLEYQKIMGDLTLPRLIVQLVMAGVRNGVIQRDRRASDKVSWILRICLLTPFFFSFQAITYVQKVSHILIINCHELVVEVL